MGQRQLVLAPGPAGSADSVRVYQPSVLRALNGTYLMYYSGSDGSRDYVLMAMSPDGYSWSRFGVVQFLNDGSGTPFVMIVGTTYHMWFDSVVWGTGPLGYTDRIYHSTSSDGITWSAPVLALDVGVSTDWDGGSVAYPAVVRDASGTYRMYYTMYAVNRSAAIGLATSVDLVTFTKWPGNPVFLPGAAGTWEGSAVGSPSVVPGSTWTLFYRGWPSGPSTQIGVATSADGYHWIRQAQPLLPNDAPGTWDSVSVASPSFLPDHPTAPRLYFDGDDGSGSNKIGVVSLSSQGSTGPCSSPSPGRGTTWWTVSCGDFLNGQMDGTSQAANGSLVLGPALFPTNRQVAIDVGPPGAADSVYARTPFVLKDTDGSYKMWYTGYDGSRNRMLYATSLDGVHWTKHGVIMDVLTPPYYFDSVGSMSVIKLGSTYQGWFHAGFWTGGPFGFWGQVYHAVSTDGANWTVTGVALPPNQSWDIGMTNVPKVLLDSRGVFWMYFTGWDGSNTRLGVATSPNGTSFVPYAGNPILPLGPAGSWDSMDMNGASVLVNGSAWTMWYDGTNRTQDLVGLAHSSDGFNWTKAASNPVIVSEPAPSWDDHGVGQPDLLVDTGGPRLYFIGSDGSYIRIGTANLSQPSSYMGSYTSGVFDSGTPGTRWQNLSWVGAVPPGSAMDLLVRVGNDSYPDATWTPWIRSIAAPVPPYPPTLENLTLPRDRFFQFLISFTSTNSTIVPWVQSVTVTFSQDQGPVTGIVQPGPVDWARGPPVVSWSASDPEGDAVIAAQVQISSDPAFGLLAFASPVLPPAASPYQPATYLRDGTWYLRVTSEDAYGVWGNWTERAFGVDTTAPIVSILSPAPNAVITTSAPAVRWSAADIGSGVERVEVSVDGGTPRPAPAGSSSLDLPGLADGTHTIAVHAYDLAGNVATATVSIRVDTNLLSPSGPLGIAPSVLLVAGVTGAGAAVSAAAFALLRRRPRVP